MTLDMLTADTLTEQLVRSPCLSRWSARIVRWGESMLPPPVPGWVDDAPVIVRTTPALGPGFAASCVGIPINYALRRSDLARCQFTPDGGFVATHDLTFAGYVESCRADDHGLLATLAITRVDAHVDLCALDEAGDLGHAGLCLVYDVIRGAGGEDAVASRRR